jgi:hypothetical protein
MNTTSPQPTQTPSLISLLEELQEKVKYAHTMSHEMGNKILALKQMDPTPAIPSATFLHEDQQSKVAVKCFVEELYEVLQGLRALNSITREQLNHFSTII